jgi:hypothetical protein
MKYEWKKWNNFQEDSSEDKETFFSVPSHFSLLPVI